MNKLVNFSKQFLNIPKLLYFINYISTPPPIFLTL